MNERQKQELKTFIFLAIVVFSFISLISYDPNDIGFFTSNTNPNIQNWTGGIGAYFAWFLYMSFGYCAYLFPLLALIWTFTEASEAFSHKIVFRIIGVIILFISSASLFSLITINSPTARINFGGISGLLFSNLLHRYFGTIGSYILVSTLFILSLHLATEFLIWPLLAGMFSKIKWTFKKKQIAPKINIPKPEPQPVTQPPKTLEERKTFISKHITSTPSGQEYEIPSIELLNLPVSAEEEERLEENLQSKANILEKALADFGIEAKVIQIDKGPVITRYELQPAAGVKVQRIVSLSNDIALSLKAMSVRVVAPIPGKDRIGIEVPNSKSTVVYLREILESDEYQQVKLKSKLTLAIGKDITGEAIICDLGSMPHLLIAGTTGSGKTVCVNSIITSFLFNTTPEEVKFIMVDPKMVELAPFNGIPHLLSPVITNPKKVQAALNWAVSEMEGRYETFAEEGTRNIEMYNKKVSKNKKLPYIIIVIDELADLMAVASNAIENAITRLSQLSRAVGIHIILATQRPSVDVITGIIKANFPTRISFKVSSKVDSRTVLDANGADKLIGSGDMLFLPPGSSKLIRVQAPLVTDEEIEKVVNFIKKQREPSYNEEILERQNKATKFPHRIDKKDELFEDAVKVILETGHASVSMLQRRLALGYTRAARLIDAMEQEGIIGSYRGSKPREILVNREEYLKKLNQGNK